MVDDLLSPEQFDDMDRFYRELGMAPFLRLPDPSMSLEAALDAERVGPGRRRGLEIHCLALARDATVPDVTFGGALLTSTIALAHGLHRVHPTAFVGQGPPVTRSARADIVWVERDQLLEYIASVDDFEPQLFSARELKIERGPTRDARLQRLTQCGPSVWRVEVRPRIIPQCVAELQGPTALLSPATPVAVDVAHRPAGLAAHVWKLSFETAFDGSFGSLLSVLALSRVASALGEPTWKAFLRDWIDVRDHIGSRRWGRLSANPYVAWSNGFPLFWEQVEAVLFHEAGIDDLAIPEQLDAWKFPARSGRAGAVNRLGACAERIGSAKALNEWHTWVLRHANALSSFGELVPTIEVVELRRFQ